MLYEYMLNRRVASTLTFAFDLYIVFCVYSVGRPLVLQLTPPSLVSLRSSILHPKMVDTHLPTPAASSSTSPTALDSADKKRPRDSTTSTTNKTPATKKAKAEGTNGDVHTKETKGVFCHQ